MLRNRIAFLSVVASTGIISATLCAPALPFIADHFSTHFSNIQFTISIFLVGNALGQLLSGPLSDRIGSRTVLLGWLSLFTLASCGCALAGKMWILLLCRFLQGMGSAGGPVLSRAIASSSFPPERSAQVQSYGAICVGIASMLAIFSSGYISLISWRGNFWMAAILGLILYLWTLPSLEKTDLEDTPKISFREISAQMLRILKHPVFFGNAACLSITYGLMYGYIALFPFLVIEVWHEKNPAQVGIYSAYMIASYMLGALFASRRVLQWPSSRVISLALFIQIFSGVILVFLPSPLPILSALLLFNFGIGILLPITSANALAPFVLDKMTGAASSTLGLSYRLIGSILSMLVCQFPLAEGKNLGLAIFFLSLCSWGIYQRFAVERRRDAIS